MYAWERLRRERLLGEAQLSLVQVNLDLESNLWLTMDSSLHTYVSKLTKIQKLESYLKIAIIMNP